MRSVLYILLLSMLMLLTTDSIGISPIANGKPLDRKESTFTESYLRYAPASIQMHYYIKKYAEMYKVPLDIAYKIARLETNYKGPTHFTYNAAQTSYMNAYGPFQILLSTAREVSGNPELSKEELLNNIDLNVCIGIKYLSQLYNEYHSWAIAAGYYNTGRPQLNEYAMAVKSVSND